MRESLEFLGKVPAPSSFGHVHIVRLLVGDTNLTYEVARQCAQEAEVYEVTDVLARWAAMGTTHGLSGDVMWCSGAIVPENVIPIGTRYDNSGILIDNHDTVGATLITPFRDIADGVVQHAMDKVDDVKREDEPDRAGSLSGSGPSGAVQLAGRQEVAQVGVQREDEADHWPAPRSPTPLYMSEDESDHWLAPRSPTPPYMSDDDLEARHLEEALRNQHAAVQEDALVDNPALAQTLGSILFQKKTVTVNGQKLEYVASKVDSVKALKSLLGVRNNFLHVHSIPRQDEGGNPTVLSSALRDELLDEWKMSLHNTARQRHRQLRDSWKETRQHKGNLHTKGKGKDQAQDKGMQKGTFGPKKDAVRKGQTFRVGRHLQREYGVTNLALLIVFTVEVDPTVLRAAQAPQHRHAEAWEPSRGSPLTL